MSRGNKRCRSCQIKIILVSTVLLISMLWNLLSVILSHKTALGYVEWRLEIVWLWVRQDIGVWWAKCDYICSDTIDLPELIFRYCWLLYYHPGTTSLTSSWSFGCLVFWVCCRRASFRGPYFLESNSVDQLVPDHPESWVPPQAQIKKMNPLTIMIQKLPQIQPCPWNKVCPFHILILPQTRVFKLASTFPSVWILSIN
jgi:hypothetical protein